jgi:hypothetical protein
MLSAGRVLASLALALALAGAALAGRIVFVPVPPAPPAKAPVGDPAEPPLRAEVDYTDFERAPLLAQGQRVTAVSSAAGTTLTLETRRRHAGTARLTFKEAAAPMAFTVRLAGLPEWEQEALTVTSGRLRLPLGPVTATPTTSYFDMGRGQKGPDHAVYAVTARRWGGGVVDVQLRRAPGAALSRQLTVSWKVRFPETW